jgi:hypothetical protein
MNESILQEAQRIIHGDRNADYGHPIDNHATTAALWNAYIAAKKGPLGPEDVCYLNALQKISRAVTTGKYKRDTPVDIAGYAGNVEMIQDERERRASLILAPLPEPGLVVSVIPEIQRIPAAPDEPE